MRRFAWLPGLLTGLILSGPSSAGGELIFANGFEEGDTSAWSNTMSSCRLDVQCTSAVAPACAGQACICSEGACILPGCSSSLACSGGDVCIAGVCTTAPSAADLNCRVLSNGAVVRQGQTVRFSAAAVDASGLVVPGQTFTWRSSYTAAASIDDSGVATGGSVTGTTSITCRVVGGIAVNSPAVTLANYANVAAGNVRAVVVDATGGQPLAGAIVVFYKDGAPIGSPLSTDANGTAEVTTTPPVSVHVFKPGYTYVSLIDVNVADMLVPLGHTVDATRAGGLHSVPDTSELFGAGTVDLVLLGSSAEQGLASFESVLSLSQDLLLTPMPLPPLVDRDVPLPPGLLLDVDGQTARTDLYPLGAGGERAFWALGKTTSAALLISRMTPHLGGGSTDDELRSALLAVLPQLLNGGRHGLAYPQATTTQSRVTDLDDVDGDGSTIDLVPNYSDGVAFPTVSPAPTQRPLLSTEISVPALPQRGGAYLKGALALVGTEVPATGFVPLGMNTAYDNLGSGSTDGIVDGDELAPGEQPELFVWSAPPHDGLEDRSLIVALFAFDTLDDPDGPFSGILTPVAELERTVALAQNAFLDFAETAAFDPSTRILSLGTPVLGTAAYRARFREGANGEWWVYFKTGFTLPAVPLGLSDRAVDPCPGGGGLCTDLRLEALSFANAAGLSLTLEDLARFDDLSLATSDAFTRAVSSITCQSTGSCIP